MSGARLRARLVRGVGGVLLGVVGMVPPVSAAEEIRLSPPGSESWEPLRLPRVKRESRYEAVRVDGIAAVRGESRCSASGLVLPVKDIDLSRTPLLRWRWRVDRGLPARNERVRSGDDFAARVYVLFQYDPDQASLWERIQHRLGRAIYGDQVPGRAINFVWSSAEDRGEAWPNPFTRTSWMVSLGRGELGQWREEEVDVAAEHRMRFEREPTPVVGIALMTDSDNICREAVAYFANFRFASAPSPSMEPAPGPAAPGSSSDPGSR